jgi:GxxExxY protein
MDSIEKLQRFRELSNQYEAMTYNIIGAALEVHKQLGCGFLEAVYGEALELELNARSIPFEREKMLSIVYKGQMMKQYYVADFVCYGSVIVELKAVSKLESIYDAQVLNYLKATNMEVGLLLNFGEESLVKKRLFNLKKI